MILLPIKNTNKPIYYINQTIIRNLSKRELQEVIKSKEYERLPQDTKNKIDLLLFNIEFNCYVVVELKVTELKKEHIGQIQIYMNYIDSNLKKINQDKTIGIIICKQDNKYVIEYCSDKRIIARKYVLV